jgi:hypothetical protein
MEFERVAPEGLIAEGVKAKDLPALIQELLHMLANLLVEGGARSDGLGVSGRGRAVQAREGQRAQCGERDKCEGQDERLVSRTRRAHGLLLGGTSEVEFWRAMGPRGSALPMPGGRRLCTRSPRLAQRAFARQQQPMTGDKCRGEDIPDPVNFFPVAGSCGTRRPQPACPCIDLAQPRQVKINAHGPKSKAHVIDLTRAAQGEPGAGGGAGPQRL